MIKIRISSPYFLKIRLVLLYMVVLLPTDEIMVICGTPVICTVLKFQRSVSY